MARQLVVLALVLIALAGVVSVAASSPGGSPPSARTGASRDGSATSSSRPSQATATSPTGDSHKNYGKKKSEGADSDDSLNEDISRAKPRLDKGCPDAIMKEVGERKLLSCLLHEGPYNVQDCSTKANLSMIGMPLEESEADGSGSDRELQISRLGGI
ncbi:hypothetical protein Godav_023159 [Gossypium davidsonii]|uniref:Uncharacterized protein n=2 Tax=Gossypium TaxID=3633 RepID=A0A7J8SQM2_GOSDV|nr:hypothetical protein [Gossypium davidsonii]